jgi:RNase H-fold protein (predicted Holliday junction resolvase)
VYPSPSILALDPSSAAIGWAIGDRSGAFAPLDWRGRAQEKNQRHRQMCGRAGEWLADMITDHAPDVIVIEVGGGYRRDQCSERLRGALFLVTWTREVATVHVAPTTWRAWAKRCLPGRLTKYDDDGKPDDVAAQLILEWFMATQAHHVESA